LSENRRHLPHPRLYAQAKGSTSHSKAGKNFTRGFCGRPCSSAWAPRASESVPRIRIG